MKQEKYGMSCRTLFMQIWKAGVQSMSKYDKMLETNRKSSEEKINRARGTIQEMLLEQEKITIPVLMKKTGLSRGFFYKNPVIRKELDRAQEQQSGMVDPRRQIMDLAMDKQINELKKQNHRLKIENARLKEENEKLLKALGKKNLSIVKKL